MQSRENKETEFPPPPCPSKKPTNTSRGRLVCITSILWGELPHSRRQGLVELMLAGDEGLADGLLPEAKHAAVAPHLVHEGLKHHPFLCEALLLVLLLLLCIHGLLRLHSRTHPPLALTTLPWALAS